MLLPQPTKENNMDLAKLTGGSGIIKYRGLELESKEGIFVTPELETTEIPIDGISAKADERVDMVKITITVTPTGKWTNPDRLFPYLGMPSGRYVLPVLPVSINTTSDVLTAPSHGFHDGDRVMCGVRAGGTLPAAVDETTFYFVRRATADTFTLHATRAGALANTGKVDFATAGTSVVVIGQFDLEVIGEDGERITFHATAITKQPELNFTRTDTPIGEVEFTAYLRNGYRTNEDNAFYTIDSPGWSGWTAEASDIPTQSPWLAWADQLKVATVDTTDNEVDFGAAHGLSTEAAVYIGTTGVLPAATPALDPERKYYVRAVNTDSVSLHLTAAAATAGTGAIDLTDAGTGTHFLTVDNPPFSLLETEAGVQITSDVELEERTTDRDGVVNAKLSSAMMEAKFIPLSLGASNVLSMLKLQGTGAELGRSLSAGSKPLNIFSAGIFVRVNGAAPKAGELAWNMTEDRTRELTFVNTRVVSGGTLAPVGVIGTEIP
jgi:hypothetical protein